MARPSHRGENLVISNFTLLIRAIDEINSIDGEIESLACKMRNLKSLVSKKKNDLIKNVRKCSRNYVKPLFDRFQNDLVKFLKALNESYFMGSKSLNRLIERIKTVEFSWRERDTQFIVTKRCKRVNDKGYNEKMMGLKEIVKSHNGANIALDDAEGKPYFPIWDKNSPAKLRISNGESTDVFNLYDPGYYPNPLSDFMEKL